MWQGMGLIQDTEADVMTECLRKLPIPSGFIFHSNKISGAEMRHHHLQGFNH